MVKWWWELKVSYHFMHTDPFHPNSVLICASISSFCCLSAWFHFRHFFSLRYLLNALLRHNYRNPHWWKCYHLKILPQKFPYSRCAGVFFITNNYIYLCMSVNGLKSFESSYCVLNSPTRSNKKFCMSSLGLKNSLTIKSLFLGSVIVRNNMFLLAIFFIFWTRFCTWFWT